MFVVISGFGRVETVVHSFSRNNHSKLNAAELCHDLRAPFQGMNSCSQHALTTAYLTWQISVIILGYVLRV